MPSFPFQFPNLMNTTPLAASGNSNPINLPPKSGQSAITLYIKFTLGSLTNAAFVVQALYIDATNFYDVYVGAGGLLGSGTLTASTNLAIPYVFGGVKQIRVRYTTTGVTTSSAAVIDAVTNQ